MPKGIIFDMDGVMFDTENLAVEAWRFAWSQFGIDMPADLVKDTIGLNLEDTFRVFIEHVHTPVDLEAVRKLRMQYGVDYIKANGMPIKPGLSELLDYLKANGFKIGVATSTVREKVTDYFEKAGITGCFHAVISGDMVARGKPEPDIYRMACDALHLAPSDCIALEDSPAGITAAHSAGIRVIMIPDLAEPSEQINPMLYAVVPDLHHVIGLLQSMD